LCGYDGALVGCACFSFLSASYSVSATVLLSLLAGVVHVACANILNAWHVPCFTFAFNLVVIHSRVAAVLSSHGVFLFVGVRVGRNKIRN
jgi:urea transporter